MPFHSCFRNYCRFKQPLLFVSSCALYNFPIVRHRQNVNFSNALLYSAINLVSPQRHTIYQYKVTSGFSHQVDSLHTFIFKESRAFLEL